MNAKINVTIITADYTVYKVRHRIQVLPLPNQIPVNHRCPIQDNQAGDTFWTFCLIPSELTNVDPG
jgi:hypothetical protein